MANMSIPPTPFDPYATLGVAKDAVLADIKASYRKIVLRCHPDKIQDESLRNQMRDQFQRVQQAYELLSDERERSRYDQKVLIAALKKETLERAAATGASSPYSARSAREYRDGRVYEERTPADTSFFEEDVLYTEEPQTYSRKHDDYHRRPRTSKGGDEKKKAKSTPTPTPTMRSPKESPREFVRSSHSDRAKYRTKERRREHSDKYERRAAYGKDDSSDSDASTIYVEVRRPPESRRSRETPPRRERTEPLRRSESSKVYRDEDDQSDGLAAKHDILHTSARDYILRSKASPMIEVDSRPRVSHSPTSHPAGYDSSDRDKEPSRHSRRTRSKPDSRTASPRRSQRKSSERLDASPKDYDRSKPPLPTANSSPAGIKLPTSRGPPVPTRSTTAPHGKVRREGSSRSESASLLRNMVDDVATSRSKLRPAEKYDSGYSSPGTPEMAQGAGMPKMSRYKIVEPPETGIEEPDSRFGSSPPRQERPSTSRTQSKPSRTSTTYSYSSEALGTRHESPRSSSKTSPTSATSARPLYGEIRYTRPIHSKDVRYGIYDDERIQFGRRQSAY
jgi:curved DNA-binding protein CbpA